MYELKSYKLVIEKNVSKNNNVYYALFVVLPNDNKIFITYVSKYLFDILDKE